MKAARVFLVRLALIFCGLFVAGFILEHAVRIFFFQAEERRLGAGELWKTYSANFVLPVSIENNCAFLESLTPHPYLGTIHHRSLPCSLPRTNNIGIYDRAEFPRERDPEYFTIMLLGGSVAAHLGMGMFERGVWLEDELNKNFISPNGKPFRIVSGAIGGWSLPNQLTMLHLFGSNVDAAVAIDGANEAYKTELGGSIFLQDPLTYLYISRPSSSFLNHFFAVIPYRIRRFVLKNPLLKESFLLFTLFEKSFHFLGSSEGAVRKEQYELVGRFTDFPDGWSEDRREQWNKNRYAEYIRLLHSSSEALGIKYAHFVQPMVSLGKELSPEEKQIKPPISANFYRRNFVKTSEDLGTRGFHTQPLIDIFQKEKGTIYSDHVHCKYEGTSWENRGYRILSSVVARYLARFWNLKPRNKIPAPSLNPQLQGR